MPVSQTKTGLQDEAYRLYQLDWMASHGESPESLAMSILEHHVAGADPEDPDTQAIADMDAAREAYDNWESEAGFHGDLWVCKDEFLGAEFKDAAYMRDLLPTDLFAVYCRFHPTETP